MALASLPPNPRVMEDKPRKNSDFIITRSMLANILITGSVFVVVLLTMLIHWGDSITITGSNYADPANHDAIYRLSIFFTTFVLLQFWNLFNARAFDAHGGVHGDMKHSKGFLLILLAILAGQILIVTFGDGVFRTVPVSFVDWLIMIASTSLIYIGGRIIRTIGRHRAAARR